MSDCVENTNDFLDDCFIVTVNECDLGNDGFSGRGSLRMTCSFFILYVYVYRDNLY